MFWCISYYLGAFGTVWLRYENRCKKGRTSAQFRATKSRLNFLQRTYRVHPIRPQIDVLVCFILFGCIWDHLVAYETRCKTGRTSEKFVPRSRVRIFRNERNRSTPLDPKLMFWCVLYYMGAFGTISLPYETRCKTGLTSAKVRATKSCWNFSQRTHPIHPNGP